MFSSLTGGSDTNMFYILKQIHAYKVVQAEIFFIPAYSVNNFIQKS